MGRGWEHMLAWQGPAPRTNGKLSKMVAIFTPALEGNCMAYRSIGSYFTVTLGSNADQDSFLAAEAHLLWCCQGTLSAIMCCLLHHKFFPNVSGFICFPPCQRNASRHTLPLVPCPGSLSLCIFLCVVGTPSVPGMPCALGEEAILDG